VAATPDLTELPWGIRIVTASVLLTGTFEDSAEKPVVLLESASREGVVWLRELFFDLARSPWPTGVRLDGREEVSFSAGTPTISLWHRGRPYHPKLVRGPGGDLIWTRTAEEWRATGEVVGLLLDRPGHWYLTSGADDHAVVEVSFGDPPATRTEYAFELGHPGQQRYRAYSPTYPDRRDAEVDLFVAGLREGGTAAVEQAIALASDANTDVLQAYAWRAAVRVVRGEPADLLVSALVALAIATHHTDPRDILRTTSLIDDAAHRGQLDVRTLFRTAGAAVGPRWSEFLAAWPDRRAELRTPESMGYQALDGPDGFGYGPRR
jgi:hypothetical protein